MKAYQGVVIIDPHFFTSALIGGEWSASHFSSFTRWERPPSPGTHWIGGWGGLRTGLDNMEKRKFLPLRGLFNTNPLFVEPIASRYTDCAIPDTLKGRLGGKKWLATCVVL
jgi:hypothetical protein